MQITESNTFVAVSTNYNTQQKQISGFLQENKIDFHDFFYYIIVIVIEISIE